MGAIPGLVSGVESRSGGLGDRGSGGGSMVL